MVVYAYIEAVGTYEAAAPAQSNEGATTGETPAAPAKADPNKSPNTSESNTFVLFMLGIIAVAGMGLYAGKRQEN
ncbi:MAG: LPXTG cell wall anchor domain-containing protein [Clostridia bacterium]|nr:LPXTG cell wall anchor domain-containing protein [Clostridia bacterium]